ncbi:protein SEMI-ROLLED LEAF 2 [Euphorbia lathyris]|uniref:protein SEMI-ROLLED LEAF 2 n=1 Tax=Euphorbia lathyris TaxID=212925 RepID=UPI003313C3C7
MGVISRKLFPACETMCICCPALRSRSRQPVKRYKKLLSEIFSKSDGHPKERKIVKLCEYAAKNPFRIPKIAKFLEDKCCKELRSENPKYINTVTETYNKLLFMCKDQKAYFALNLLNVVSELLEKPKQDALIILGCQTLTGFIYSQTDGTYSHNIEKFVNKVCYLAREHGKEHHSSQLRAYSLQCLSAMVWFMTEFSYIFAAFDEIVQVTLDNYEADMHDDERADVHHNWVDEVVRSEGRGSVVSWDTGSNYAIIRPRPEKKDPSLLTRDEIETPRVWARICVQRLAELAKESTTMRQVLEPMLVYFDSGRHWVPRQGLSLAVLSDMCYLLETSGHQQLVLAAVVRHLDHKNVIHDTKVKSYVILVAAALARQIRSETVLTEIGYVSDLCWHLRKSLQATVESVGEQESNMNISLQNTIEDCLLEISKGIGDAQPLFDLMAITLENMPSSGVVARATIGSLIILAHMISLSPISSRSQLGFPEAVLAQLLKVMLHPVVEVRVGAHQIFSMLLIPSSTHPCCGDNHLKSGYISEPRRWRSDPVSASSSITTLLEKLRKEKDGPRIEKNKNDAPDNCKERDSVEEDRKQGRPRKNSPNFYTISSIIDRTSGTSSLAEAETYIMKFSEDQVAQLLSALWLQAILPDNLPSNIEAIAHSFMLTLISSRLKSPSDSLVVRCFQLSLSLRNLSLDPSNGMLHPACRRSIFVLSTGMLMFSAKIYQIPRLNDLLKSLLPYDVDPYLGINDDLQVLLKPQADVCEYGSARDSQLATSVLHELRSKIIESDNDVIDTLIQHLSNTTELEVDDLARQLLEPFTPDAFVLGSQSLLDSAHNQIDYHSKESLSFDEDIPSSSLVEDDAISEASVADMSRFIPKMPSSPSVSHIISIGQLLESALEVAGQVAGASISTSPLPYDTMAKQCEDLGKGTRTKLSNWLSDENLNTKADKSLPALPVDGCPTLEKIMNDGGNVDGDMKPVGTGLAMRLPPASPFDNFLKAAGC